MPVSIAEYLNVRCNACGRDAPTLTWLAIDLVERPELRATFGQIDSYFSTCQACREPVLRDAPLFFVGISSGAPLVLACPDGVLLTDDPSQASSSLLREVADALARQDRDIPGPFLMAPFDVSAIALTRDVDRDAADPDAALASIEGVFGKEASERYGIFLRDVADSRHERRMNAALDAILHVTDVAGLEALLDNYPELLSPEALAWPTHVAEASRAAGDAPASRIAIALIALLERCAAGDAAGAWAQYSRELQEASSEILERQVGTLQEAFDIACAEDLARAAEIGERLVAKSTELRLRSVEAEASARTAAAYYARTDGDRAANVERSRELLERAAEIYDKDPDFRNSDHYAQVLLNLGATLGARLQGDPAANHARAIRLQRRVLEMVSMEGDGHTWAMAHTNLGLNLLESERITELSVNDKLERATDVAPDVLGEAIHHFEQALRWRSFEREPLDWAYTQLNLALAYFRSNGHDQRRNLRRAIEHAGEAVRGFAAAGDVNRRAQALGNRASARVALARLDDTGHGERAVLLDDAERDAREAVASPEQDTRGVEFGRRWSQLATVLAARDGDTDEVRATFRRALEELTPRTAPRECRDAGRTLAALCAEAGDWVGAADAGEQAALAGAAAVEARATRGGRFAEIAENGTLFRWAAYALIRAGRPQRAVEILELGRARELASWLEREVVDLEPLRRADPRLCARFLELRQHVERTSRAGGTIRDPTIASVFEALDAVVKAARRLPGLEGFLERPSLADLCGGFPAGEIIAYPVTSPFGSAWLLLAPGSDPLVTVIDLPEMTSTAIVNTMLRINSEAGEVNGYLVEQSRAGLGLDDEIRAVSHLLGPDLMRPLSEALVNRVSEQACIVPLGTLGLLPLQALTWEEDGNPRCLLDTVEVAWAPSAYVRMLCHARAGAGSEFRRFVAVGNPLPQTSALPGAEYEAASVGDVVPAADTLLLLGYAATKEAVVAALPSASHVHLACHGRAAASTLVLDAALSFDHDRALSGAEILDLDLSRARLVVASACETAVIAGYETIDESLAFSTLFLGAGAAGVVATLWSVEDYATSLLMTRFYEELVGTPDVPARALRAAQLWLRDLDQAEEARYAARHRALSARRAAIVASGRRPSSHQSVHADGGGSARFGAPTAWAAFVFSGA